MSAEAQWLSVGKTAELLGGVHPETVRRYLREGLLRGRRLTKRGNRWIDPASVQELLTIAELPEPEQTAARDALVRRNLGQPPD